MQLIPDASLSVSDLEKWRDSMNASIDYYILLARQRDVERPNLDRAQEVVYSNAANIAEKTNTPARSIFQLGFGPNLNAAVRAAIDLDIFNHMAGPTTTEELALKTGADHILIIRLMRALAAFAIVDEISEKCYAHNNLSRALIKEVFRDFMKMT